MSTRFSNIQVQEETKDQIILAGLNFLSRSENTSGKQALERLGSGRGCRTRATSCVSIKELQAKLLLEAVMAETASDIEDKTDTPRTKHTRRNAVCEVVLLERDGLLMMVSDYKRIKTMRAYDMF